MEFRGLYDIRDMRPDDKNFIMASFLRGLYYGDPYYNSTPKNAFMEAYKKVAEQLVDTRAVIIKVACLKEDADVILGYALLSVDHNCLIWAFTKTPWRKRGIAKSLLPQQLTAYMHSTAPGKQLLSKFPGIVFNPFYPITKSKEMT